MSVGTTAAIADRPPLGSVTWGTGGHTVAALLGRAQWRVTVAGEDDPQAARNLGAYYAGWDSGPTLHYGQGILPDLAELMGGTHVFHQPPPSGPDEIN